MAFFYDKITIFVLDLKTHLHIVVLIIMTINFVSCNEDNIINQTQQNNILFTDFEKIPQQPFLSVDFTLTTPQNKDLISSNQFVKTNQDYFERLSDSTIVIFEEEENLNAFKIYLKSHFYMTNNQLLFDFLTQQSTAFSGNYVFAEMEFNNSETPFTLTYFTTQNQIRIHFIKQ